MPLRHKNQFRETLYRVRGLVGEVLRQGRANVRNIVLRRCRERLPGALRLRLRLGARGCAVEEGGGRSRRSRGWWILVLRVRVCAILGCLACVCDVGVLT